MSENNYPWWAAVVITLAGGGLAQLLSTLVNYLTKKKSIDVSDESKFRQDLMEDGTNLREEIKQLKKRCDDLETTNRALNETILVIQKAALEKERDMEYEINTLKHKVNELEEELAKYKKDCIDNA